MRNTEISVSRNFSLPLSLVVEVEKTADDPEHGYYNRSDFARKAFRRELDFQRSLKEEKALKEQEQKALKNNGVSQ
jgi:metal-responsive CopG/Arc/MetJ family transcriptional regulator